MFRNVAVSIVCMLTLVMKSRGFADDIRIYDDNADDDDLTHQLFFYLKLFLLLTPDSG